MKKQIPCKLNKSDKSGYMSMFDATVCDLDSTIANTVAARYYKGIGANRDNMVIETDDESISIPCQLDKKTGAGDGFHNLSDCALRKIGGGIASAITARYYKGAGGDGDNLVIELTNASAWETHQSSALLHRQI